MQEKIFITEEDVLNMILECSTQVLINEGFGNNIGKTLDKGVQAVKNFGKNLYNKINPGAQGSAEESQGVRPSAGQGSAEESQGVRPSAGQGSAEESQGVEPSAGQGSAEKKLPADQGPDESNNIQQQGQYKPSWLMQKLLNVKDQMQRNRFYWDNPDKEYDPNLYNQIYHSDQLVNIPDEKDPNVLKTINGLKDKIDGLIPRVAGLEKQITALTSTQTGRSLKKHQSVNKRRLVNKR